jgi:hypothetical protein
MLGDEWLIEDEDEEWVPVGRRAWIQLAGRGSGMRLDEEAR